METEKLALQEQQMKETGRPEGHQDGGQRINHEVARKNLKEQDLAILPMLSMPPPHPSYLINLTNMIKNARGPSRPTLSGAVRVGGGLPRGSAATATRDARCIQPQLGCTVGVGIGGDSWLDLLLPEEPS